MGLYRIEPLGIGTWEAESLPSFIRRLAYWHGATVPDLVDLLQIGSNAPVNSFVREWRRFLTSNRFLDSILEDLTRNGFSAQLWRHTFLAFSEFDPDLRFVLTNKVSWCPVCVAEDEAAGRDVYFRLIWNFSSYETCIRHSCRMQSSCPACGSSIGFGLFASLTSCTRCGCDFKDAPVDIIGQEQWNADLICLVEDLQSADWPGYCADSLSEALSRTLDLLPCDHQIVTTLWREDIKAYHCQPTLFRARRLAAVIGCSIKMLFDGSSVQRQLFGPFGPLTTALARSGKIKRGKKRPDREILAEILHILHSNIKEPLSLRRYSEIIGFSVGGIHYRFPAVADHIVQLYKRRLEYDKARLRLAAKIAFEIECHKAGETASKKAMLKLLHEGWGFPKNTTSKELNDLLKEKEEEILDCESISSEFKIGLR